MLEDGVLINERYRVTRKIGSGGMAEVYEALDIVSKDTVALKMIKRELLRDAVSTQRFSIESRAAASLNHPNIVRVFDVGIFERRPYMITEYIKGQTVRSILDYRNTFPLREACSIMLQLTDAVAHAHSKSVVHCDIKTANFFIMADGSIKLADFGLARIMTNDPKERDRMTQIAGSVHYLAPEILQGYQPTFASDIYSLGIVFFELLSGQLPYDEGTKNEIAAAHINKAFPRLTKLMPKIPKEIEAIIEKATQKKPQNRYKSAQEMHNDILRISGDQSIMRGKQNILQKLFGFKGTND